MAQSGATETHEDGEFTWWPASRIVKIEVRKTGSE